MQIITQGRIWLLSFFFWEQVTEDPEEQEQHQQKISRETKKKKRKEVLFPQITLNNQYSIAHSEKYIL